MPACQCQQDGRLPVFWLTKEEPWLDESISKGVWQRRVPRLSRAARNSEFLHSQLQCGSLHGKMCRCAVRAGHNPIGFLESLKNLLAFRFLQNAVKCAIC